MADKLIGSLSMDDLGKLRKMTRPMADAFLISHTLSDVERARVNDLIGRDLQQSQPISVQVHDPNRGLWMISAWLAGASWRQLARYHGIAPQTVMNIADRRLTSSERQSQRLKSSMSLEALDTYHASFIKNLEKFALMRPQEVAQWLLDNTELDK